MSFFRENNPNNAKGQVRKETPKTFKKKDQKEEPTTKEPFMGAVNNPKNRNLPSHIGEKVSSIVVIP